MPRGRSRKAKSESKSAPATAPPSNELSDEQRRYLFVQQLEKLEELIAVQRAALADVRNQRKLMKTDGFSPVRVNYALELRSKAPDEMLERERERLQTAAWLVHDVGYQANLFDDYQDRTPAVERAYDEGKIAAYESKPCRPPYDASTEQGQRWINGHRDAQANIASGFKQLETTDDGDARPRFAREREKERRGMPGAQAPGDDAPEDIEEIEGASLQWSKKKKGAPQQVFAG